MNASSSEAIGVSSCSTTALAAAISPIRAASSPVTVSSSAPLPLAGSPGLGGPPAVTLPPAR